MYVLMIVPSDFPEGDAGAIRDMAFAEIYREIGYETVLIGMGKNNVTGNYKGVKTYSLYKDKKNLWDHIRYFLNYKKRCSSVVEDIIAEKGFPSLIHINDIPESMINYLIRISQKRDIPIVHDSTEWYSKCEFTRGEWDKAYILKNRLNMKVIRKPIRVLAISSFLKKHFIKKGLEAVRIPVIMDVKEGCDTFKRDAEKIQIVYAGSPAKKDYLGNIITAYFNLEASIQQKIDLHIIGVNENQLLEEGYCDREQLDKMIDTIHVYGRIPHERVISLLRSMDFSILARPREERYAKAGFPTKSVEAMINSVAMLCNFTSDLDRYLRHKENAFIFENETVEAIQQGFVGVAELSADEIVAIRKAARKTAEENFDYRLYIETMKEFLGAR